MEEAPAVTYIVGISGISSSGKTTLARYLRRTFNSTSIPVQWDHTNSNSNSNPVPVPIGKISFHVSLLHQDDFFLPESKLPVRSVRVKSQDDAADGTEEPSTVEMVDWDFPGAIDFAALKTALQLLRQGVPYHDVLHSMGIKETEGPEPETADPISTGPPPTPTGGNTVSGEQIRMIQQLIFHKFHKVANLASHLPPPDNNLQINIILLDGFMLYHQEEPTPASPSPSLIDLLDLKLLLRVPYATAKQRREARAGYITGEGFWEDPKGYFDGIVWPNYVRYHRHLFTRGDVERGGIKGVWGVGEGGKGVELLPEGEEGQGEGEGEAGMGDMEMVGLLRWASLRVAEVVVQRLVASG